MTTEFWPWVMLHLCHQEAKCHHTLQDHSQLVWVYISIWEQLHSVFKKGHTYKILGTTL